MAQLKGGQAVVESLRAQGVDTVFGIISTHMMEVYDALYDHRDAIRFISARHEHAAALMADGCARVTGKPGVCLTSTGCQTGGCHIPYRRLLVRVTLTERAIDHIRSKGGRAAVDLLSVSS